MPRSTPRPDDVWTEYTVPAEEAGRTTQEILVGPMAISRRMLQRLTRSHGIRLNGRPAFLAKKVRAGDVVGARTSSREEPRLQPVAMPLSIVHEDGDVIVVDKAPGVLVHPTAPHHTTTLANGIAHHLAESGIGALVRPVHRIDRDTSGLVVFAKSAFAHQHLDRQLREGALKREYLAVVTGRVAEDEGTVDAPIGRHRDHPNLRAVRPNAGEPAVTRYRVEERFAGATLLRLDLETGRTHQIRVHMAHLGHSVVGDREYGGRIGAIRRQALHAAALTFQRPSDGAVLTVQAPLPTDIERLVATLRSEG